MNGLCSALKFNGYRPSKDRHLLKQTSSLLEQQCKPFCTTTMQLNVRAILKKMDRPYINNRNLCKKVDLDVFLQAGNPKIKFAFETGIREDT